MKFRYLKPVFCLTYFSLNPAIVVVTLSFIFSALFSCCTKTYEFGDWEERSVGTVYMAETDGFVNVTVGISGTTDRIRLACYTDGNNPPTTLRGNATAMGNADSYSFTTPVKSGDFWLVEITAMPPTGNPTYTVYWIPLEEK
jgi:hypothetical protein